MVAAQSPAASGRHETLVDSLKALGILVDKNKITNNPLAVEFAKRALSIARSSGTPASLVDAYNWMGMAYLQSQKDSAYYYYNQALHMADSYGLVAQKATIYFNLAKISTAAYNYKTAIELLDSSIQVATMVKNPEAIANAYMALGTIHYNTHDFDNSKKMFDNALKTAREAKLYKQMGVSMANLARNRFESDLKTSISIQKEALAYLDKVNGVEEEVATIYINLGSQQTNADSALYYYNLGLKVALRANLTKILLGAYNNMAYSYLEKKNISAAEACLRDKAIPLALEARNNDYLSSLYDTYADVFVQKGDFQHAYEYQKKAMKARDADNRQKAAEQVRLLAAQLELKNKELIIQKEEQALLVQANRLQQTELWLAIALLLVVGSVFTMLVLQQRNRVRLQHEKISSANRIIEMEESEKGRTARELHDITGQLVLGISGTIDSIDFPDPETKETILARIKELGSSIRKISHRMNRAMIEHFSFREMIEGLCEDVQKLSKLRIELRMDEEFPELSNDLVMHFYRITQELLTNAGKYARESLIQISVTNAEGKIRLMYHDNGPGFNIDEKNKPSMGILNIFERAKLVGGHADLSSAPGKGTTWNIIFPVKK